MNKDFLKKCWEDKRLHSLMILIIWIIVLAVLMGIIFLVGAINGTDTKPETPTNEVETKKDNENTEEQEIPTVLSYYEKLEKLSTNDYAFTYTITKYNEKVKFEGTKENNVIEGYKQDNTGIIKYKIQNQKVYQVYIDHTVAISNLYENIDASLLDLNYVISMLKQVDDNDIVITEEESVTTYLYNLTEGEEELEITVIENNESIEEINIHRNNEIYELIYEEK